MKAQAKGHTVAKDKTSTKSKTKAEAVEETVKTKGKEKASKAKAAPADDDEFASGAPTSDFKISEVEGELVLITPLSVEEDIDTVHGSADAIKANIVVLDEKKPAKSESHDGALIFQRVLQSQLGPFVGKRKVLGRIGRGVAKKGQDAPYVIEDPTEADKAVAREYLRSVDPLG